MAKTSKRVSARRKMANPKFKTQAYNRCPRCGRARAFLRKFHLCRLCFRKLALEGSIPGVIKASW